MLIPICPRCHIHHPPHHHARQHHIAPAPSIPLPKVREGRHTKAPKIRELDGNLLEFDVSSQKLLLVLQSMNIMDVDKGTSNAVAVEADGGTVA